MLIASTSHRRLMWLLLAVQLLVFGGLLLYPVNSIMVRVPMLALIVTIWVTVVALVSPLRWLRNGVLALPVIVFCALTLPARVIDTDDLRQRIVAALRSYEGATYVWGGENSLGDRKSVV